MAQGFQQGITIRNAAELRCRHAAGGDDQLVRLPGVMFISQCKTIRLCLPENPLSAEQFDAEVVLFPAAARQERRRPGRCRGVACPLLPGGNADAAEEGEIVLKGKGPERAVDKARGSAP